MTMRAVTYLGENTVPILDDLVARLRAQGFDITITAAEAGSSPDARAHAAEFDLVWMCGSLAAVLLVDRLRDHDVVAAPVFGGEAGPVYRSVIVTRDDGPQSLVEALDTTIGVNELDSWSGHHGLRRHLAAVAGGRWFRSQTITGSHRRSIEWVRSGRCTVAGIDATIWAHVAANAPRAVEGLRVLDTTADWPSPPFLVRRDAPRFVELTAAMLALRPFGLDSIVPASATDYRSMLPDPGPPGG